MCTIHKTTTNQWVVSALTGETRMVIEAHQRFTANILKAAIADSYDIRRNALQNKVTYYTTLSGARAACIGMNFVDELQVESIQNLHKHSS